jgi:putative two-component system response regulator
MVLPDIKAAPILLVGDRDASLTALASLLDVSEFTSVTSTTDFARAVQLCGERDPDLVLIDVETAASALELLGPLSPWTGGVAPLPVVVLADDVDADARVQAMGQGARDALLRPVDPRELVARAETLLGGRLALRRLRTEQRSLQEQARAQADDLARTLAELETARHEVLRRLALAAEYRDDGNREHTERVGRTAGLLAERLGLGDAEAGLIRSAAPLHDVGKLGISDSILLNPGKLTQGEFELMKTHSAIGAEILTGGSTRLLQVAEEIALTHHERWDGGGYPGGLSAQAIPLTGRIVALADTFDVITHERPYRGALGVAEAVAEIRSLAGQQFDPRVVEVFGSLDHAELLAPVEPT